jgi:hypothetical protein
VFLGGSSFDVQTLREADCDTDHSLVVAKVRERLAVSKQTMHSVHVERFNLKKIKSSIGLKSQVGSQLWKI